MRRISPPEPIYFINNEYASWDNTTRILVEGEDGNAELHTIVRNDAVRAYCIGFNNDGSVEVEFDRTGITQSFFIK